MSTPSSPRIRALLATVLLVVVVIAALEFWFRRSPLGRALALESVQPAKARELSDPQLQPDILILGDSRIFHGIHPDAIQRTIAAERGEQLRVYNGGMPGAPPMGQLALLRRALSQKHPPRLVVLSISPYMFSSRIVAAMARESLSAIWRVRDLPAALRAGASAEDLALITTCNLLSLYRYRPRLLDILLRHGEARPAESTGAAGYIELPEVDPVTQRERGRGRAMGYRTEMWKPGASFGNEHMGYFVEALRTLQEAGIDTMVLNSPSASQIELAYGPNSLYDEHIAWVSARAAQYGAIWADVKRSPAIADEDFVDGDHLGRSGAARFSAWLAHQYLVPALGGQRAQRSPACKAPFELDADGLQRFTHQGTAFDDALRVQARRWQQAVYGYVGETFVSTFGAAGDGDTGEALSPAFVLQGSLRVRVAGGSADSQSVTLLVNGQEHGTVRGRNDEVLRDEMIDTSAVRGQSAQLRIRDQGQGPWEHLIFDDVAVCP